MASSFKIVDYPAVGASYQSPSLPANAQRTVNLYPEAVANGLVNVALHTFPGLKNILTGSTGEFDRGCYLFKESLYQVAGGQLYQVTSDFVRVAIGAVGGSGQVSISDNGHTMVIVTGGDGEYTYDGTTFTSTTLGLNPSNVEYLNARFLYDDDDGRVGVTNVGALNEASGNFFEPESSSDVLVRTYIFNQFVYLFGSRTIEPWQPVASGSPPYQRMNGAIIENVGLASRTAITNTEQSVYFISDKGDAQQLSGFSPKQISTVAINNVWRKYTISDAIVQTLDILALNFVIFSFPTNGKTWGYVEQYNLWFELEHGTNAGRWKGNTIVEAYGTTLAADYATGNMYELDPDTYTDNGETTLRERIFAPLAGEKFGKPRQRFRMTEFGVSIETGVGNATEINPVLMVSFALDGAQSFSNERFIPVGQEGQYKTDVRTSSNKVFSDLTVRLRYTEPTKFSLFSSYIKLKEGTRK
tara:strand:+ start:1100 stop:2512 length:1413 start_codon:yes stop_codon:yes gene_type:complete